MSLGKPESCPCPRCGQASALDSYDEADVGIGVIRGNESWDCPEHGVWCVLDRDYNGHAFAFQEGYTLLRAHPSYRPGWVSRVDLGRLLKGTPPGAMEPV